MSGATSRPYSLPRDFPVGTRYVVEGSPGADGETRILSRYILFPDGRRVDLPTRTPIVLPPRRLRRTMQGRSGAQKRTRARPFLLS